MFVYIFFRSDVTSSNTDSPKSTKRSSLFLPAPKGGNATNELLNPEVTAFTDENNSTVMSTCENLQLEAPSAIASGWQII